MCDITDEDLYNIIHGLTVYLREKSRDRWLKSNFKKISRERLFKYWRNKVDNNEDIKQKACALLDNFKRNITQKTPSKIEMAKSLATSMKNWVKQGFKVVDQHVLDYRLDICKKCEFWDPNQFDGRCLKCGCVTQFKTRLAHEKCPINKWMPDLTKLNG